MHEVSQICEEYANRGVAGVFFSPMEMPQEAMSINARIADALDQQGIVVVLLDRDVCDFPRRSRFDLVGIDNVNAGYVLTEHLLGLGHRQIGFIQPAWGASTISARIAGYREALKSHNITPVAGWVRRGDTTDLEFVRDFIERVKPEAVVCVNDHEAARLMRSLAALSVKVPEDVAIVGVDNDMWATLLSVSLTTLQQPCAELAAAAMKLMLERFAEPSRRPREVCLACRLIVRESSGARSPRTKAQSKETGNAASAQPVG